MKNFINALLHSLSRQARSLVIRHSDQILYDYDNDSNAF
jgi:hypothetical protein